MIKLMVEEYILMQMELNIMENGKTTNNTEKVLKLGLMEQFMKVNIMKERKMDKENYYLQMVRYMKDSFR